MVRRMDSRDALPETDWDLPDRYNRPVDEAGAEVHQRAEELAARGCAARICDASARTWRTPCGGAASVGRDVAERCDAEAPAIELHGGCCGKARCMASEWGRWSEARTAGLMCAAGGARRAVVRPRLARWCAARA